MQKEGYRTMKTKPHIPQEIILQFLQDNKEGIRQILTWFLNTIMEYEAYLQSGAEYYQIQEKLIEMVIEKDT